MLYRHIQCRACGLAQTRTRIVEGRGLYTARILVLGEAPGKSEDVLGISFIGESGQLMDGLLERARIPIGECFFTNTVLCRPCDVRGGENREPTKNEIATCHGNVMRIIGRLINLKAVVFAGKIAKLNYKKYFKGYTQKAIIHPAALYRQGGPASSYYRDALNALKEVKNEINA